MELVSIIMPAYNAGKFIEDSIRSVLNQTYHNWELLIVNDGSTDNTRAIAEEYSKRDKRIKVINQENKRLAAARNTGIKNSTGEWIAFLDSDDIWATSKLEKQVKASGKLLNIDVFYTDGWIFKNEDLTNLTPYPTNTGQFTANEMYLLEYNGNCIPVLSVMAKRDIIDKIGFSEEDIFFNGCEDWDCWLRMARAGANFYGLDEKLFYYRQHDNNMSNNYLGMRLARAAVYIKNFDAGILSAEQGYKILRPLIIPLLADLVIAGRRSDAEYVFNGVQNILPSRSNAINYFFIKRLGKNWYLLAKIKRRLRNLKAKYRGY